MGLDLKLNDGKLVSIPYIQTDGRTDKKMDRPTQIHLRYYSYVGYCIDTNNFFNFDWIATKIALLPGK